MEYIRNDRKSYHNFSLGNVTVKQKQEEIQVFPVESRFVEPTFTGKRNNIKKKRVSTRALGTNPRAKGTNPRATIIT